MRDPQSTHFPTHLSNGHSACVPSRRNISNIFGGTKKKKKTKTLGISRAKYAQERAFYSFFWPRIGEENEKKKKNKKKKKNSD